MPTVQETVRIDLLRGEFVDVQDMHRWTDDTLQIEHAKAYLAELLRRGWVMRVRGCASERYVAVGAVDFWLTSGCVAFVNGKLWEVPDK